MTSKTGGPAFPNPMKITCPQCRVQMAYAENCEGMTLRDYFAAKAISLFPLSSVDVDNLQKGLALPDHKLVAVFCYELADAMLKEREK